MTVIFDLYLFTPKYVDAVKQDKRAKDVGRLIGGEIEYEIGTVACRNSQRPQPIFFYDADELIGLLEAAYEVSAETPADEPRLSAGDFPDNSVIPIIIELDSIEPYVGRFIDPDGAIADIKSPDDLKAKLSEFASEG